MTNSIVSSRHKIGFMGSELSPGLTLISPFSTLCFSTHLLIEMTKAITMTLLAKRHSLDPRLALVKDIQQAVRATLEFKMLPETLRVSLKHLMQLRWARIHSQTPL